jgi:hypothetical protein
MMKRRAFWALLAVGMTIVSTGVVNAQSTISSVGLLGEFQKKSIVGSWVETVKFTTDPGRPDSQSLVHFNGDGTLGSSDQGGVQTDPPPTTVTSDGVGVWKQVDWRTFSYTELALFSDFSGNLTGSLKVSGTYVLKGFGDMYEGTSFYEVLGPDNSVQHSGYVANKGMRIHVEPTPTPTP